MSTSTRRTQAERTATTRAALLAATVDVLVERGYRATTTQDVARRAGVSYGALLHHEFMTLLNPLQVRTTGTPRSPSLSNSCFCAGV